VRSLPVLPTLLATPPFLTRTTRCSFFYNTLLAKKGGQHVVLGLNTGLIAGIAAGLIVGPKSVVLGSGIGGIRATQEVVDLCAKHGIFPETQIVGANDVNGVYEKLEGSNDSGVRYVLGA